MFNSILNRESISISVKGGDIDTVYIDQGNSRELRRESMSFPR